MVVEEEADTIIPGWTCNDPTLGVMAMVNIAIVIAEY